MNFKGQPYKPLTSPRRAIRWVLVDMEVLPTSPSWNENIDRAAAHIIMPAFSYIDAKHQLNQELPKFGYQLRYVDDFEYYKDVQWKTPEDKARYDALFRKAEESREIQFGRIYFYSSKDDDDDLVE